MCPGSVKVGPIWFTIIRPSVGELFRIESLRNFAHADTVSPTSARGNESNYVVSNSPMH
jgi:hypothetical protein